MATEVVYPKATGWVSETIMLVQGDAWDANDPFVKANPQHFTDSSGRTIQTSGRAGAAIEQATAAPGEKRAARRTSKADTGADSE